jgi:hypothetical protein
MFSFFYPYQTITDCYNYEFVYELINFIWRAMVLSNLIFLCVSFIDYRYKPKRKSILTSYYSKSCKDISSVSGLAN